VALVIITAALHPADYSTGSSLQRFNSSSACVIHFNGPPLPA
jgi:hypothetical protein